MGEIHEVIVGVDFVVIAIYDLTNQITTETSDQAPGPCILQADPRRRAVETRVSGRHTYGPGCEEFQFADWITDVHNTIYMHWLINEIKSDRFRHTFWNTAYSTLLGDMRNEGLTKADVTRSIKIIMQSGFWITKENYEGNLNHQFILSVDETLKTSPAAGGPALVNVMQRLADMDKSLAINLITAMIMLDVNQTSATPIERH
eukprot:3970230-Heterocapsa_arctica.AAC.1